ncbi:beta-1,4-N-acetylgalactosaminyltransferase bre-4 [Sitophilus oryzae]|uniref:Beta-1,4-N-acetylgalactosaminyltransferase n=1 Tax=Sitophilus oryzae TaxID=7048 RepID=A0A6J2XUQ6_SITOR|nr:beta-1,4-N-acetylgalactosaminyltransferase bre-4 [Sitophilus oryzae]XP_030754309.1 beta-1,4-N-acetylgalactosaminyltransferase bre-4 [Sitophilus oryzae]XP_030754310.1 beta-1,4-N-acetylgalactosaminyltransferase bre-4 [Sitophilus oryzae]
MSLCAAHGTPYKGLFVLILVFVALEYFFNSISDTKDAVFNTTSTRPSSYYDKSAINYGPLLKTLLFKNHPKNSTNNSSLSRHPVPSRIYYKSAKFLLNISNFEYIVTIPPFLTENITSTYGVISSQTGSVVSSYESQKNENVSASLEEKLPSSTEMPLCPDISQTLYGRVQIVRYPVPSVQSLEERFSWLRPGGHWSPPKCSAEKKVAIVIPFRCRGEHLLLFLQHMHPFLKKQQLDYTIFVVEQEGDGPFNRAMLMNVGYVEALKQNDFDCFIFHDIDLLPEDDRNIYSCPQQPRHMSVAVDIFKYKLPYPAIFGGVSAISTEHFKLLNGFSNSFWGWGGEDDDMSNRIRHHHLYISRYPITIARYTMLTHTKDKPNPNRYDILRKGQKMFDKDGLNNLSYELVRKKQKLLYTWILVKLNHPKKS